MIGKFIVKYVRYWNKYSEEVFDTFDEVAYISSFQSKPEALRYAMSKGLGFSSVVCRY